MTPEQIERLIAAAEKIGSALDIIAYKQQHPGSTIIKYTPVDPSKAGSAGNDGRLAYDPPSGGGG